MTTTSFYALGAGYTAWMRYDHNRIDLVPERASYKPGDTARIMIQSPWERATALLTTEREGIRTQRRFALTSTQQTVTVPITEADIPNVYVSVLLIKGRTPGDTPEDASDPGKPSFRLGYVELQVEDASKRLSISVTANRQEYRPANNAKVDVLLKDAQGKPAVGEVTLWAVDYGVLSLTGFQTPDVLRSVYVPKALQVTTEDSRQRIVSRRAIIPKGADDGGGGGADSGAGTLRRDFRVLAFWVGSTVTDGSGKATVNLKLPESLTTYRIMAVSGDKTSRFGWGQSEIRVNKPVALRPAFPRFLAVGDRATFGSVVTNQLSAGGQAVVTIKSLDPSILRIDGVAQREHRGRTGSILGGALYRVGARHRQGPCADDGPSQRGKRRLRGRPAGGSARLTGDGCGVRPDRQRRVGNAGVAGGSRSGLRRPDAGDVVHGADRPRRGRAVPARVSVRLRRAEGIAGARTGAGRGSRIRVPDAGGERRAGAAACAIDAA